MIQNNQKNRTQPQWGGREAAAPLYLCSVFLIILYRRCLWEPKGHPYTPPGPPNKKNKNTPRCIWISFGLGFPAMQNCMPMGITPGLLGLRTHCDVLGAVAMNGLALSGCPSHMPQVSTAAVQAKDQ